MAETYVRLSLAELTTKQRLRYAIELLKKQQTSFNRLESTMADLTSSVSSLQTAVDAIAVRFASQAVPLDEALQAAQSELAALAVENEADKAALAEALANAQAASDAINAEVAELNGIGANPDVPVEPVPVEELPPAPSEGGTEAPADAGGDTGSAVDEDGDGGTAPVSAL